MTIPGYNPYVPADTAGYLAGEVAGDTPVEAYEFFSEGTFYRYTSAAVPLVLDGNTFEPEAILREQVEQGTDFSGEQLDIQLGDYVAIVDAFRKAVYGVPFYLRVYREHLGAPSPTIVAIWEGEVSDLKISEGIATFTVQSASQSVNRTIPRYTHQSICNHQLYGPLCKVNRAAVAVVDTVVNVGINQLMWVEIAAVGVAPAGYFVGGVMTWIDGSGFTRKRFIMTDDTANARVYLLSTMPIGFAVGASVELVPGCDRQYPTCRDKFANTMNFGGFPWAKTRDPSKGVT